MIFNNLKPGTYSILVNDIQGCTPYNTTAITITEPAQLLFTATSQNATGFGIANGTISFTNVSGGSGSYTAVITGIAADGTYKSYVQLVTNGTIINNIAASGAGGYDVKITDSQ